MSASRDIGVFKILTFYIYLKGFSVCGTNSRVFAAHNQKVYSIIKFLVIEHNCLTQWCSGAPGES